MNRERTRRNVWVRQFSNNGQESEDGSTSVGDRGLVDEIESPLQAHSLFCPIVGWIFSGGSPGVSLNVDFTFSKKVWRGGGGWFRYKAPLFASA